MYVFLLLFCLKLTQIQNYVKCSVHIWISFSAHAEKPFG